MVSEIYDSKYLKASDIGNRRVTVEIEAVSLVEFDKKLSFLLNFKGKKKAMRVNKTNGLELSNVLGQDTDDWVGAKCTIATRVTMFQGKPTPGLVLLDVIPNPNPQPKHGENPSETGSEDTSDIPF